MESDSDPLVSSRFPPPAALAQVLPNSTGGERGLKRLRESRDLRGTTLVFI